MHRLRTTAGTILAADNVARAVVRYAATLTAKGRTDSLSIPTVDAYGQTCTTEIILGPGIVVISEWADDDELEPDSDAFLVELEARSTILHALPILNT